MRFRCMKEIQRINSLPKCRSRCSRHAYALCRNCAWNLSRKDAYGACSSIASKSSSYGGGPERAASSSEKGVQIEGRLSPCSLGIHQLFHPYLHLHLCFVGQLADIQRYHIYGLQWHPACKIGCGITVVLVDSEKRWPGTV